MGESLNLVVLCVCVCVYVYIMMAILHCQYVQVFWSSVRCRCLLINFFNLILQNLNSVNMYAHGYVYVIKCLLYAIFILSWLLILLEFIPNIQSCVSMNSGKINELTINKLLF